MSPRDAGRRRASVKPSEAEAGSKIGLPADVVATITEAEWTTWGEAGETALKGGREAEDPALKITAEIEGVDDPVTEFLGAGKASRGLVPSSDGQFLELEQGASASAINDSTNAKFFLGTIFAPEEPAKRKKSEAYKRHGEKALSEALLDDAIGDALVGLKFLTAREVITRDFGDRGDDQRKPRPTLACAEIIEAPGSGKTKKKTARTVDEDEAPARGKGRKEEPDEDEAETAAEKAGQAVLESKKFNGEVPVDKLFGAVYNLVKEEDNQKDITAFFEDEKWIKDSDRPWAYNKKTDSIESV